MKTSDSYEVFATPQGYRTRPIVALVAPSAKVEKLNLYGAIARAFYFQRMRQQYAQRAECNALGIIARFVERWM
jgi:hypothetical protein